MQNLKQKRFRTHTHTHTHSHTLINTYGHTQTHTQTLLSHTETLRCDQTYNAAAHNVYSLTGRWWKAAWTKTTYNWDKTYKVRWFHMNGYHRPSSINVPKLFWPFFLFSALLFHFFPLRPISMTTETAFSLPSLTKECISPNKKAFTRLIKRHCNAVCNAQFTHLIHPLVLFNFIRNQSVGLSSLPYYVDFSTSTLCSRLSNLPQPAPFWAFPVVSSSTELPDHPFLLILSLGVANSGQQREERWEENKKREKK